MAELSVESLRLAFGGLVVLNGISLGVEKGELLALIGPNGAGKTSVLNCISGLYRGEGRIALQGRDITGLPPNGVARAGIARTFQHGELFPHMSVIDNLMTARHALIRSRALSEMLFLPAVKREEMAHREAVERIIEFVELERYRYAEVDGLAFGLQKLIGFARALAMEPKVLLLDEPSAGLTRDEREDLARFILRVRNELRLPMIWIEHDMQMIADLADRVHVLDYGRTIAEGKVEAVLKSARVIEAYLGKGHGG